MMAFEIEKLKIRCLQASTADWMAQQCLMLIREYVKLRESRDGPTANCEPKLAGGVPVGMPTAGSRPLDGYGIPFSPGVHRTYPEETGKARGMIPSADPLPQEPWKDEPAGSSDKGSGV